MIHVEKPGQDSQIFQELILQCYLFTDWQVLQKRIKHQQSSDYQTQYIEFGNQDCFMSENTND